MIMAWIWTIFLVMSTLFAALLGRGSQLSAAVLEGRNRRWNWLFPWQEVCAYGRGLGRYCSEPE